jgi:hypothetical protein
MAEADQQLHVSIAAREEEEASEEELLLQDTEQVDDEGRYIPFQEWLDDWPRVSPLADLPVTVPFIGRTPFSHG